jgi:hypothetical protein
MCKLRILLLLGYGGNGRWLQVAFGGGRSTVGRGYRVSIDGSSRMKVKVKVNQALLDAFTG